MTANPLTLRENESSSIKITQTTILDNEGTLTETRSVPDEVIGDWKVNGVKNGNSTDGTISGHCISWPFPVNSLLITKITFLGD